MPKIIPIFLAVFSLYGCGGSSEQSDDVSIIGDWYIEFERNGATGESHLVITESEIDTYEIGNGQIMDEWYTGLDIDKRYKFEVDGASSTYTLDGNTIIYSIAEEQSSTARILELPSENVVYSWEISNVNAGEETILHYKLVNGSLVLTDTDQQEYVYTLTGK